MSASFASLNTLTHVSSWPMLRRPPCFWFYGPRDGMYTNNFHTIWQQNREFDGHIEFDLQIVNTTTGAITIKRGVVDQAECSELPAFALD